MTEMETRIRDFFDDYGRTSNDGLQDPPTIDAEKTADFFAAYFVGSTPQAVFGSANDASFRKVIPQGFADYRKVGGKQMSITDVKVTPLDDIHAMAEVGWDFAYLNSAGKSGNIRFTNFYFLTTASGSPKIFAYITADEEKAMKDHGLV